jgi:hypothetical protein
VTMQFIRCSAWLGSVRFGFLTPEIFMRICLISEYKIVETIYILESHNYNDVKANSRYASPSVPEEL